MNSTIKALILSALDEERQRMGAVRGPLFRAVEKLEKESPDLTFSEVQDILAYLHSEHLDSFSEAITEYT